MIVRPVIRLPYVLLLVCIFYIRHRLGLKPDIIHLVQRLGPSWVKLGQTLSVRPDIVGEAYATRLSELQDNMRPFSQKKAVRIIESQLQTPLEEVFEAFEPMPVAAASIAQVHRATLRTGEVVAVKVLRPGITKAFKRDLALFYMAARCIRLVPSLRRLRPVDVIDTFRSILRKELDLRLEAASASEFADYMRQDAGIYVPKIYWKYVTEQLLVMEWVEGIPVHDIPALRTQGHSLPLLAQNMYLHFLNQAYRDGFFHADLHPGNLFVRADGTIVPVDFGIMGRLDEATRLYVAEIVRGFLTRDYPHVADIHFKADYVPKHQDKGDFILALRAIGEPILNCPARDISLAKLLALLFKVTRDFNMHTQPQLLLLQKTLILVEGVCKQLDPDINLWDVARPWMEVWGKKHLGLRAQVRRKMALLSEMLYEFPSHMQLLYERLESKIK